MVLHLGRIDTPSKRGGEKEKKRKREEEKKRRREKEKKRKGRKARKIQKYRYGSALFISS